MAVRRGSGGEVRRPEGSEGSASVRRKASEASLSPETAVADAGSEGETAGSADEALGLRGSELRGMAIRFHPTG